MGFGVKGSKCYAYPLRQCYELYEKGFAGGKKILSTAGGATGIYKINPMGFYTMQWNFFRIIPLEINIRTYAILGGIPHYLSQWNPALPRLAGAFFRFWYTFGFTNYSQLEDGDVEGVYEFSIKPRLDQFASLTFEDVCREFLREQQRKNMLPFRYQKMGRWFGKTTVRVPGKTRSTVLPKRKLMPLGSVLIKINIW